MSNPTNSSYPYAIWMRCLGYGGLIPFLGLAGLCLFTQDETLKSAFAQWNLGYGACIVSFLGAVHWGLFLGVSMLLPNEKQNLLCASFGQPLLLAWSVLPALLAWVLLSFIERGVALWIMGLLMILTWTVDKKILGTVAPLEHYTNLRSHLTVGASLALFVTAGSQTLI